MKINTKFWVLIPGFILILGSSCERDNPANDEPATFSNTDVSEWIYEWMNEIYLWNDEIDSYNPANEPAPLAFFEKLLYREEDKWSFATDDFQSFMAELSGTPTSMGFSPAFGKFSSSDRVFIVVEYVIPGTPAEEAGLERGDIIITIDGAELNTTNYLELYRQNSFSAGLGIYGDNTIYPSGETVSLTAEVITVRPVLHSEVIEYESKKIGYLVYVDFVSGTGNVFVSELDKALSDFASAGIDELIVDLRYNPGGEVGMASYLASSIAPDAIATPSKVLVSYVFNDVLTDFFLEDGGPNSLSLNLFFMNTNTNLNLDQVYFMTSSATASASELVITGLEPYMDVVVVGDTTYGKYTGSWVFPDTEEPARHNYAIVPIVLKYANSEGVTEFKNGLIPDYPMEDELLGAGPFGSFNDLMLAKTLEIITGINPLPSVKKSFATPDFSVIPDHDKIHLKSINTDILRGIEIPGKIK